jgi:hypothetical protein
MAYWRGSESPLKKSSEEGSEWISQVGMRERHDTLEGIVYSDKVGKIFVDQSGDGKNWDFTEEIVTVASTGKSFNIALVAPFWRIRFKNTTNEPQTTFRISVSTQAGGDS